MSINIELPQSIEARLRADLGDLDSAGKEAMLVELYRQGKLSHGELATGLGLSRYETDDLLTRHNVIEDLITGEDLNAQLAGLRSLIAS
jgi:predicted HTH domain antitoxin